ncbi:MAG: UTP--glucose-1-phosphate uridylyltransferase GalU [Acidimicrobiia bacterium]|nr:UTP--glucose-1-phosphate uridylyltransferase GalU [Acidimicrobiia bacterium]
MSIDNKITTAVIPAAGLGTRFLPLTKSQPKEMLPIVDKPAIQYVVEEAVNAGITDILVITGRGKRAIEDHFDRNFELDFRLLEKQKLVELEALEKIESLANIHYIRQRDAKGLGDAVGVARYHVGNSPFVVMLGDDIMVDDSALLKSMLNDYKQTRSNIIALMRVEGEDISNYGCVALENDLDLITSADSQDKPIEISKLVEKPNLKDAPSNLAIMGRYILNPEIFDCIESITAGSNGEIQLTDAISLLSKSQKIYGRILERGRFDIGQKSEWIIANVTLAMERPELRDEITLALKKMLS